MPKTKPKPIVPIVHALPIAKNATILPTKIASIVPKITYNTQSRKLEEADGPIKLKTLSYETRQEITNRRVAKLWTQADLNKFCSFPQNIIRDTEAGRYTPNQQQLNVLNRILKGGIHYS